MNDRARDVIDQLSAEADVASLRAFVYEMVACNETARSFAVVSRQSVPTAFQQFTKRVLGEGYVLVSAMKVDDSVHAELLATPFSKQRALKLWDDETLDRVRELTERRGIGEHLLLRCAPLAYDLATQLVQEMSAEAFLQALPTNEDEAFAVRCLLDVFAVRTKFSAGLTQLVSFALLAPPPATVTSSAEEDAKGWVVRGVSTSGTVTLATGTRGRKYSFECPDQSLLREAFDAWYTNCTVAISFLRVHPVGLKRPALYGVLQHVEMVGTALIPDEPEQVPSTFTPPMTRARPFRLRQENALKGRHQANS